VYIGGGGSGELTGAGVFGLPTPGGMDGIAVGSAVEMTGAGACSPKIVAQPFRVTDAAIPRSRQTAFLICSSIS
jgi:hypothetical protein